MGVARREGAVYAGFELELDGAERYGGKRTAEVNTLNCVLIPTAVPSQNHLDAPPRLRRSFTRRNSPMLLLVSRGGLRLARLTGDQALIVEAERAAAAANARLGTHPGTVLF